MGASTSSFEAGPPSLDLERPVLFYGDSESERKLELDNEPQMTPLGEKLLQLYLSDQLPASDLFWADSVRDNVPKLSQYFSILGQLYELFLTPHTSVLTPNYYTCSYLKLYESRVAIDDPRVPSSNEFLQHFLNICEQNITTVYIYPKAVFLNFNQQKSKMLHALADAIFDCYSSGKDAMIIPLTINDKGWGERISHRVFVALKKTNEQRRFDWSYPNTREKTLQFMYIDPHGFDPNNERDKIQRFISALVLHQVNKSFYGYFVRETNFECPTLQRWEQGGNCIQWFFYNLYFFLKDPDAVTHMSTLRNLKEKTVNIHLFELAIFLKTMPFANLKTYHDQFFLHVNWFTQFMNSNCGTYGYSLQENLSHLGVENCVANSSCPQPCVHCGSTCNFQSAVKLLENSECKPLSPKMIARKMLYLYAELRKIAGQDPSVVTPEAIEQQLNYEEPKTLTDFQRLYGYTDDDLNRVVNWTPGQ